MWHCKPSDSSSCNNYSASETKCSPGCHRVMLCTHDIPAVCCICSVPTSVWPLTCLHSLKPCSVYDACIWLCVLTFAEMRSNCCGQMCTLLLRACCTIMCLSAMVCPSCLIHRTLLLHGMLCIDRSWHVHISCTASQCHCAVMLAWK